MHKIYWLEYVNANNNHYDDGVITETFWTKSDMNKRRYELKRNFSELTTIDYGYDVVDLD